MSRAERDWQAIVREVDAITARAAKLDRDRRAITPGEVANGFSELARLRRGVEPDYDARGLGTAYLLYYLARRALNTADACLSLDELTASVRVLDIGAGTNAGALALAVAFPGACFEVTAVEPSPEMASAGAFAVTELSNIALRPVPATLEEVMEQQVLTGETFDLVMMSALLPYEWRKHTLAERVEFGEQLLLRLRPGGQLLVIEPSAKLEELEVFASCLERTGITYRFDETNMAAENDHVLEECTAVLDAWHPRISRATKLSDDAWEMLGGDRPYTLRAGSARPDVILAGVRRVGVAVPEQVYPAFRRQSKPPSAVVPQPSSGPRIQPSTSTRVKVAWMAGAAVGIAAAVWMLLGSL